MVPNRSGYVNAGQSLPALKSRQVEAGLKHSSALLDWQVAAFDIERPAVRDIGTWSAAIACIRQADGQAHHRALKGAIDWRIGPWNLRTSAMLLQARRERSADAMLNGLRPTTEPARSLKAQAAYNVAAVPGLALLAFFSHEGQPKVLQDNSVATPGWTHSCTWRPLQPEMGRPDADLAHRRGQPGQSPRLARGALPVRPRLSLPSGTADNSRPGATGTLTTG